ncbi:MAG: carboxypeptidase-like regulatory domain-containing protein, partial [Melioribacteraceae bacterium]
MSRIKINSGILTLLNITILSLIFNCGSLNAQGGKVVGKVLDADTNTPLPGVNVVILNLQTGAATDYEGDYFILNIPPGEYDMKASMIG